MADNGDRKTYPLLETEGPVARELSLGERYATLANIYKIQYFATYRQIAKRFGWDAAIEIADEMAAEAIPFIAQGYKRKFGLPGEGADLVGQVHITEMLIEGADVETIEETDTRSEYKVDCPWGDAIQSGKFEDAAPITEGLCNRGCWGFMQRVGETVREDCKVTREAWMGDGATACHFTISCGAAAR